MNNAAHFLFCDIKATIETSIFILNSRTKIDVVEWSINHTEVLKEFYDKHSEFFKDACSAEELKSLEDTYKEFKIIKQYFLQTKDWWNPVMSRPHQVTTVDK